MVGKYVDLADAYKSLNESLDHAGIHTGTRVRIRYVDSERIVTEGAELLAGSDAILVPGGFGERGIEGKVAAARFARERKIPYLGICLGMQVAVIDYARNVCGLSDANSTEFDRNADHPVIGLVTEWHKADGAVEQRTERSDMGGTMRLGTQGASLKAGSRAAAIYGAEQIAERHRHRYEFNNNYRQQIEDAGMVVSGVADHDDLVEIVELPDHPWYVAVQFHPEFESTPRDGHPLFSGFIEAARKRRKTKDK